GCYQCGYTGYQGRVPVFEVLHVTPAMAELIGSGARREALLSLAIEEGMVRLVEAGLNLARQGHTTLHEVLYIHID
ncbi:MAG: type IV pilus assembly protein PilB, partial [Halothiobacillaceae bacterium]